MEGMADLADSRRLLMERVKAAMKFACNFYRSLECYSYLYVEDRKEFMRQFLEYGHDPTSPDIEVFSDSGAHDGIPTLESFKEQIDG